MDCGYASITALNRAFKARYGMSPSDYRDKTSLEPNIAIRSLSRDDK